MLRRNPPIATALNAPADVLDEGERRCVENVREYGWHGTWVAAEGEYAGFSYSTGFWITRQLPEVIVFSLKHDVAHAILWEVFRYQPDLPIGRRIDDIFRNCQCYLLPVAVRHYPNYVGWNRWFYGNDEFPCLQLVWPDRNGHMPWEDACEPAIRLAQPDLTEHGWPAALAN